MTGPHPRLLVKGGLVYRSDGDTDHPAVADVLIADGRIAAVGSDQASGTGQGADHVAAADVDEVIDARDRLVLPGFVNAHYHSHDVLFKGCFEAIPLEFWVLDALPPNYPRRSKAELRARTLMGAAECIRSGITTVQDLATIHPYTQEDLETVLEAYEEIGIRSIFAIQVADRPPVDSVPYWRTCVPSEMHGHLNGVVRSDGADLFERVTKAIHTYGYDRPRLTWALGPFSPERCSEGLLRNLAILSSAENLPVYTHLYESKAMTLIARKAFAKDGGSLVNLLERVNLLGPRLSLAHSVWMLPPEIEKLAATGTSVVLNPTGNLKTKSGVAPIRQYLDAGVNIALGCDNCSCSDVQNMFQAMKLFVLLAAVSHPTPGPPTAADALQAATVAGARTAGLSDHLGELRPGMAADLTILDLSDPSYVPLNSVARQTVFTESGRSVETVIIDGRVVLRDRRLQTIDEPALRAEISELTQRLHHDLELVSAQTERMRPYLLEAHHRTWDEDVGVNRYVAGGEG